MKLFVTSGALKQPSAFITYVHQHLIGFVSQGSDTNFHVPISMRLLYSSSDAVSHFLLSVILSTYFNVWGVSWKAYTSNLPIFNGSGLGLLGSSGIDPPNVVWYPCSPTGSSLGGESICGDKWDPDGMGGGGEPCILCLLSLWNGGLTFSSSSGDISLLSVFGGCSGFLPLLLLLEAELDGGVFGFLGKWQENSIKKSWLTFIDFISAGDFAWSTASILGSPYPWQLPLILTLLSSPKPHALSTDLLFFI